MQISNPRAGMQLTAGRRATLDGCELQRAYRGADKAAVTRAPPGPDSAADVKLPAGTDCDTGATPGTNCCGKKAPPNGAKSGPTNMQSTSANVGTRAGDSAKMSENRLSEYYNLLSSNRRHLRDMTKRYLPALPFPKDYPIKPADLKRLVLHSERIQSLIDQESQSDPKKRAKVTQTVKDLLEEIALDRSLPVIRMLGTILNFIFKRVYTSLHVNEIKLEKLKSKIGQQPVLYLPSHRSYGDFILMSYVLFCYNIAIPGIAAGMDFYSMAGMGNILRNTGAFYMRRSFGDDKRYWYIFKEYMRQLIKIYDCGVEFFIEGTRSRSNKALMPKIGLLSMALEPLFMGEVPDVLIVPVSVSYDRPLEEQLFVYELLGVPKPRESTRGLFKALSILKENFGSIYVEFGDIISAKDYFGADMDRMKHAVNPAHVQILSKDERELIQNLANDVVHFQQQRIVLTTFHLVALYYNYRKYRGHTVTLDELTEGVCQLIGIFDDLGAITSVEKTGDLQKDLEQVKASVLESLAVHSNILQLNSSNVLVIAKTHHNFSKMDKQRLKGYNLSDGVMKLSVPIFSLQLYCNPCLHWLAESALILLTCKKLSEGQTVNISLAEVRMAVRELRLLFASEFAFFTRKEENDFDKSLLHLEHQSMLRRVDDETIRTEPGTTSVMADIYLSCLGPFVCTYLQVTDVLLNHFQDNTFKEKDYWAKVQETVEQRLLRKERHVHPYCLSLDSINLALQSLVTLGAIAKTKTDNAYLYKLDAQKIELISSRLRAYCSLLSFEYLTFQSAVTESKL